MTKVRINSSTELGLYQIKECVSEFLSNFDPLMKNLLIYVEQGKIDLEIESENVREGWWDGELHVIFKKPMDTFEIVNYIIAHARADEVSMITKDRLRLWWD